MSGLLQCFTQLCLRLHCWQSLRCLILLGHFDSITTRFFGVPTARFHLFSLFFCFMNKYGSISLKWLFLSTSPIASSRVCWGVCNCRTFPREYHKFASVLLMCAFLCALAMSVLWALRPKSIKLPKLSNCFDGAFVMSGRERNDFGVAKKVAVLFKDLRRENQTR